MDGCENHDLPQSEPSVVIWRWELETLLCLVLQQFDLLTLPITEVALYIQATSLTETLNFKRQTEGRDSRKSLLSDSLVLCYFSTIDELTWILLAQRNSQRPPPNFQANELIPLLNGHLKFYEKHSSLLTSSQRGKNSEL
eukprot:Gb_37781 [translate_table: standard]